MSRTSRRAFAKTLAVAGAALPLIAQTPPAPTAPPPATAPPTPAPPAPPSPLAKALAEVVRAQHGKHLTAEEMAQVEKDFQESAPFIERFREFKLTNADEPDFTFGALVRRW